uniref:F-box/LRR-repeat protein n=1 Tax=Rhizophora mucronata TaxID=61149 RepID=A0A2P2MLJ4_RHIMU
MNKANKYEPRRKIMIDIFREKEKTLPNILFQVTWIAQSRKASR